MTVGHISAVTRYTFTAFEVTYRNTDIIIIIIIIIKALHKTWLL